MANLHADFEVDIAADNLIRAQEIMADPKMMKKVATKLEERAAAASKAASLAKIKGGMKKAFPEKKG